MAIPVTVPRLGWSMEEGTFVEWLKNDGDAVAIGEHLFVLESEKASEPIEAIDPGILRHTADSPKGGETVKVGQVLAYLTARDEVLSRSPLPGGAIESQSLAQQAGPTQRQNLDWQAGPTQRRAAITPRARRVAKELGVDASGLSGTGRNGRVRERDVRAAPPSSGGKLIPHSRTRKIIAERMVAGVTIAAPVTLHTKVDATNLVALRAGCDPRPSFTDLIVSMTAKALREHSMLQAQWRDDGLWLPEETNVGIAIDTEAGLLAPVIRAADRLTLAEITQQSNKLVDAARRGQISAEQLRDATFTITNLGMFGVDEFTPIITLPQCAVLGVGRIADGKLTLSLTFDHRVVDGAPAARFLQSLAGLIARGELI